MTQYASERDLGRLDENDAIHEPHKCWDATGRVVAFSWDGRRAAAHLAGGEDRDGILEALEHYARLEKVKYPRPSAAGEADLAEIWRTIVKNRKGGRR